ncbi:porin [Cellvibrio sp.]|uniref:porin n=1 Tax=Cellvibrio sp. TaxID=1965322 RepID=UPI00396474A0
MKKALLPLMIASLVPAAAFADVTVYGKAFVTWQSTDLQTGQNYTELVSNASRIGLKGSEAVNEDTKVIYQFEYQTKVDDGSISQTCTATSVTTTPAATTKTTCSVSGQTFSQRNIFVGVQSNFGVVKLGMFDTPLKLAQEKIDLFNDMIGDMQAVVQGETRAKNVVQYSTNEFNHITGNFAYINSEADLPGNVNGYSASIVYNTKTIYLALANDHNVLNANNKAVISSTITGAAAPDDTDILRAVGRFVVGPVTLGALYETYDNGKAGASKIDDNGYLLSAKWEVDPKWALKAQYGQSNIMGATVKSKSTNLGVDYKLSKNATLLGYYTKIEDDKAVTGFTKRDDTYIGGGIEFNF